MLTKSSIWLPVAVLPLVLAGCLTVKTEPIDVNIQHEIRIKIDRELEDFFGEIDQKAEAVETDANP